MKNTILLQLLLVAIVAIVTGAIETSLYTTLF